MSEMDLVGIHAKLCRAEQQIQMIIDEADTLRMKVKQGIVRDVCDDDEQVWIYRDETPDVPVRWSILIGEILYNMRSALDHLVWQLVLNNEQTPGRNNKFPIAKSYQDWQREKIRTLKGASQRHQAMIGYLQPFTGGINLPFDVSRLKLLDDLGNIEKHRHLVVAVIASNGIEPMTLELNQSELDDLDTRPPFKGTAFNAKIEKGKVLARFNNAGTPLCPSFRVDVRLAGEAQHLAKGVSVSVVLTRCLDTVKGSVAFLTTSMGNAFVEIGRNS